MTMGMEGVVVGMKKKMVVMIARIERRWKRRRRGGCKDKRRL
jgi:hypothetical protein